MAADQGGERKRKRTRAQTPIAGGSTFTPINLEKADGRTSAPPRILTTPQPASRENDRPGTPLPYAVNLLQQPAALFGPPPAAPRAHDAATSEPPTADADSDDGVKPMNIG